MATPDPAASEPDFRMLFEQSPDIYLVLDPELKIVAANDARLRSTMSTRESTIGRHVFDAFPDNPSDPEATGVRNLRASLERVLATKTPDTMPTQRYDLQRPPEQGGGWEARYWEPTNVPVLRPDGSIAWIIHRVEDVTELVRMRQEQERQNERLRLLESVVLNTNDAVLILEGNPVEADGLRVVFANDAFTRLTGYTFAEVEGRNPRTLLVGPETDPAAVERLRAALRREAPARVELLYYRKDRSTLWVDISLSPVRDPSGRVTRWTSAQRDITERRQAQESALKLTREEVRRAEAEGAQKRIETILESIGDGFVAADAELRFTFMNPRAAQHLGHPREQLIGRRMLEVCPRLEGTMAHERLLEALQSGVPQHFEAPSLLRGGWLEIHVYRSKDGLSIYFRDVSERRRAEEQRERLATILESTPDFVGSFDFRGRVLLLNHSAREMLEIPDEVPPETLNLTDFHPPEVAQRVVTEGVATALRVGSWRAETTIRSTSGRDLPVSQVLIAHRDPDGGLDYFSTVMRDIAELKRAEQLQQFLAEASRTLVGTLDYGATIDSVLRILVPRLASFAIVYLKEGDGLRVGAMAHAQPAAEKTLERMRSTAPGNGAAVGVAAVVRTGEPELVAEVTPTWLWASCPSEERFRVLQELGAHSCMILPLVARDEALGAIELYSSRERRPYTRGDLTRASGVADRAAFAIYNARQYQAAQEATRLRDEVLGVVSHDLRNPLASIRLAAGQLEEDAAEEEKRERLARVIGRSADRSLRLIEDLLDVARMRSGQLTVSTGAVPARTVIQDAVELHRSLAESSGLQIDVDCEQATVEVRADHERVLQVLSNLIGNAIKFTPRGGQIDLCAEQVGDEVIFSVRDTGPGIPPEQASLIFEWFWQATRGTRSGAGLGLTIARGLVEAHHGRIWVESDGRNGSTFRFTLPVAEPVHHGLSEMFH